MTRELKENQLDIFIWAIQPNRVAMVTWCVQEEWGSLCTTTRSTSWPKSSIARSGTRCWGCIRSNYEQLCTVSCTTTQTCNLILPLLAAWAAFVKRGDGRYLGRRMKANKCLSEELHKSQLRLCFRWITLLKNAELTLMSVFLLWRRPTCQQGVEATQQMLLPKPKVIHFFNMQKSAKFGCVQTASKSD